MSKSCASIDRHGDEQSRQQMCSTLKERSQSLNEPFKTYGFPSLVQLTLLMPLFAVTSHATPGGASIRVMPS